MVGEAEFNNTKIEYVSQRAFRIGIELLDWIPDVIQLYPAPLRLKSFIYSKNSHLRFVEVQSSKFNHDR